ncbi:tryptophan halogenase family protein [Sphingomonas glacialis]|uniref:Tryptophan 7-halogenase n=1 Tax=Sphingomonas glacialis TaxID=658225 RepID=A0A502G4H9_9SPHN|nr:tryptophan halogenase family protein [Sphingomonas glacialis]TPG56471.1 tryptophan 7-halogenase [Sphingomonas glacialis]
MDTAISTVVIVGGGTAGWLAACRIAAAARPTAQPITVTLVESPDVATIGVGEGTWPTMRATLERIGIGEAEFLLACDASFKHGSRFRGWATGAHDDVYFHPFTPPAEPDARALVAAWQAEAAGASFADAVTPQPQVAAQSLAPRQRAMPDYAGALNYGYHLDAGKLAALLMRHATERLGVRHVRDHVIDVDRAENGDVIAVRTRDNGAITGDLFLDCTGHAALLVGDVPFVDRSDVLFNDRALAVQIPVAADSPIAAQTDATAHEAGWIWDIGLPTRRGVGCVYSSAHMSDDAALETLTAYLGTAQPIAPRRLTFRSGHRAQFWTGNCLAIGLSAGFLEPLEASAIVTIELSLDALLDDWPTRATMPLTAARFNTLFRYRWDRIVEFLKLHYVLSRRDGRYWQDHRDPASIPPRLAELLALWANRPPTRADFPMIDELFPAASYQYILYGMGAHVPGPGPFDAHKPVPLAPIAQRTRSMVATLPPIRAYLGACRAAYQPIAMEHIS